MYVVAIKDRLIRFFYILMYRPYAIDGPGNLEPHNIFSISTEGMGTFLFISPTGTT